MMAVHYIFLLREIKCDFISTIYKCQHCVLSKLHPPSLVLLNIVMISQTW